MTMSATQQQIAVIPSGSTIPAAKFNSDGMYFVECVNADDSPYGHNLGIVAVVNGSKPESGTFVIRNARTRKHLGLYRVIAQPAGAKFRFWQSVAVVAAATPQKRSQDRKPQAASKLLVGTTASISSQV